jgi:putative NADPH-quinone reductase
MNILIVLAHPNPGSLNHAIAERIRDTLSDSGHTVWFHDLYRELFDPLLPAGEISRGCIPDQTISLHCSELAAADGIIIVHPNWWGMPPAILAGWIDRVFRPGVAYRFEGSDGGEGVPKGLLRARAALVVNTSDTRKEREDLVFGDPLERIWKDCVFGLCGVQNFHRRILRIVVTSTPKERASWISDMGILASSLFPH